jgi:hypothetical protein
MAIRRIDDFNPVVSDSGITLEGYDPLIRICWLTLPHFFTFNTGTAYSKVLSSAKTDYLAAAGRFRTAIYRGTSTGTSTVDYLFLSFRTLDNIA